MKMESYGKTYSLTLQGEVPEIDELGRLAGDVFLNRQLHRLGTLRTSIVEAGWVIDSNWDGDGESYPLGPHEFLIRGVGAGANCVSYVGYAHLDRISTFGDKELEKFLDNYQVR